MNTITFSKVLLCFFLTMLDYYGTVKTEDIMPLCQCFYVNNKLHINCSSKMLQNIPANIPHHTLSLNLSQNRILYVKMSDFSSCELSMVNLSLSQNYIRHIEDSAFRNLAHLEALDLSNNRITTLSGSTFQGLGKLKMLDLSQNRLDFIPTHTYTCLPNINILLLQNNYLFSIPKAVQTHPALKVLSLSHNKITSVEPYEFAGYDYLTTLFLQHNQIANIAANGLEGLHQLNVLNISHNMLEIIPPAVMKKLDAISELDINENPWTCNCQLKRAAHVEPKYRQLLQKLKCYRPFAVAGQYLTTLTEEQLACSNAIHFLCPVTIHVQKGDSLKLICSNSSMTERLVYWQTPFGMFSSIPSSIIQNGTLFASVTSNGNLEIAEVAPVYQGIYYCNSMHDSKTAVTLYNIVFSDLQSPKVNRLRKIRETEGYQAAIPEETFTSAVVASVTITFFAAFVLGIFSRPLLVGCCSTIRQQKKSNSKHAQNLEAGDRTYLNVTFTIDNEAMKQEVQLSASNNLSGNAHQNKCEEHQFPRERSISNEVTEINSWGSASNEVAKFDVQKVHHRPQDTQPPQPAPRVKSHLKKDETQLPNETSSFQLSPDVKENQFPEERSISNKVIEVSNQSIASSAVAIFDNQNVYHRPQDTQPPQPAPRVRSHLKKDETQLPNETSTFQQLLDVKFSGKSLPPYDRESDVSFLPQASTFISTQYDDIFIEQKSEGERIIILPSVKHSEGLSHFKDPNKVLDPCFTQTVKNSGDEEIYNINYLPSEHQDNQVCNNGAHIIIESMQSDAYRRDMTDVLSIQHGKLFQRETTENTLISETVMLEEDCQKRIVNNDSERGNSHTLPFKMGERNNLNVLEMRVSEKCSESESLSDSDTLSSQDSLPIEVKSVKQPDMDNVHSETNSMTNDSLFEHQCRSMKRRVIKLYNYNEEGKHYDHIKNSDEYVNEPRMNQRSRSLTRLSAIMNAAMADAVTVNNTDRSYSSEVENGSDTILISI